MSQLLVTFVSTVSSSVQLCNFTLQQLFTCCETLSVAVRGAGDKELPKEGHHRASGAITRMTGRHLPPHVCPIGGWGISKGGASEAITVIPSPSDHSCQIKSLGSKLFMFLFCSVLHIPFSCSVLIYRTTNPPPPLIYFKLHHRDQKTRPLRGD